MFNPFTSQVHHCGSNRPRGLKGFGCAAEFLAKVQTPRAVGWAGRFEVLLAYFSSIGHKIKHTHAHTHIYIYIYILYCQKLSKIHIYICTYILERLAQRNSSPLANTWPIMACYGPCMRQVTNICNQFWASQVSEVLKLQVGQMNIISVWIYVDLWYILYIRCHDTFTYVGCLEVCSLNMIARHFCRLYIHMMYNIHLFNYISYVFI
jgi:hypothetical protein